MLGRHLITYLLPNAAQALASFGTVAVLTRVLSEAEYGRYALIFAAMSMANYAIMTWVEAAAGRFYAEADEKGEKKAHFATLLRANLWCSVVFGVLSVVGISLFPGDSALKIALAAAFGGVIIRSFIRIALESRMMAREATRFALVESLHTLLGFGLSVACVVWLAMGEEGPFIAMAVAAVVVAAIEGPALLLAARGGKAEPARMQRYFAYGGPVAFGLILSLALTSGDRFMIAAYLGEAEVGIYSAGYQVAARVLDIIFAWAGSAVVPLLIAAYERDGEKGVQDVARDGYAVRLALGAPAALGLALVAVPLCEILIGEALRVRAAEITPWIAAAALLAGMSVYFGDAFTLAKKPMQRAMLMIVPAVVNIGLNAVLLPRIGLDGAVISTVVAYAVAVLVLAVVGRRYVKLPIPIGATLKIAAACAAMAGIVLALPDWGGMAELVTKAGLGAIAYGCVALLLDVAGARTRAEAMVARFTQGRGRTA